VHAEHLGDHRRRRGPDASSTGSRWWWSRTGGRVAHALRSFPHAALGPAAGPASRAASPRASRLRGVAGLPRRRAQAIQNLRDPRAPTLHLSPVWRWHPASDGLMPQTCRWAFVDRCPACGIGCAF
jgi:hypothetical protein